MSESGIKYMYVFASNLMGTHGVGTARVALLRHGAQRGIGEGPCGGSYAIPTHARPRILMDFGSIKSFVYRFIEYAQAHPEITFEVTRIGCAIGQYTESEMAALFAQSPNNCILPREWARILSHAPACALKDNPQLSFQVGSGRNWVNRRILYLNRRIKDRRTNNE